MSIRHILRIARRELRGFFDQPTAYILTVAFLGLGLYLTFRPLYAMSLATLRPFFDLLPWLLVVFIPAITMKSLAEERRANTLEWLLAQPLTETGIVVGKFLGNWIFGLIALAGTLPMALGVLAVSEADAGIMAAQYIGAALLIAQMAAIGLWASSVTRNQITAFIVGALVCFVLVLIGTPVVQLGLPRLIGGWALQLSVLSHFGNVARGVVDLRDLLYFISTSALFLLLAVASLSRLRLSPKHAATRRLRIGTLAIVAAVLVLNLLGGRVRGRLDLTNEGLFTLSEGSRAILGELDDVVTLTLFASDDLPQEIQLTLRDVRDLLADLRRASNGMLNMVEIDPTDDEGEVNRAMSMGILPVDFNVMRTDELEVRRGYFGMTLTYADQQEAIPLIDRTHDLEFRLVSMIARMTTDERPTLAFASGFGARESSRYRSFRENLAERYTISTVNLETDSASVPVVPDSVDVLMIAAPTRSLSAAAAAAIENYLAAGGAAFILIERHSITGQQMLSALPLETGLEELLAARGVESAGRMVFDLASAERISVPRGILSVVQSYPFWPIALVGADHPTVRNLANLTLGWAAPFEFNTDDPAVTPLWVTSEGGGAQGIEAMIDPSLQLEIDEEMLDIQTLAVAIMQTDRTEEEQSVADTAADAGGSAVRPGGRIVAVGDAEFLEDRFVQANPQNAIFAANAVDWLAQDEALIGIRSKERTPPALIFDSDTGRNLLKWGSLIGIPLLFVVYGFWRVTGRAARARRRWNAQMEGGQQ